MANMSYNIDNLFVPCRLRFSRSKNAFFPVEHCSVVLLRRVYLGVKDFFGETRVSVWAVVLQSTKAATLNVNVKRNLNFFIFAFFFFLS